MTETLIVPTPVLFGARSPHRLVELAVEPPGPGEVRVAMAASGVCHSCLYAMDGDHAGIPTPIVLGDEGAGVIESVGPGVTSVAPGDHVVISWAPGCDTCATCRQGAPALCRNQPALGVMRDGSPRYRSEGLPVYHYGPATNAPLAVVAERAAIPISPEMPLDLAALLGCAVTTGVGAVRNTARVRLGDAVLVVGAGGVGSSAILAAALSGAEPIITVDVVPEKSPLLRELGATHCLDARDADVVEQIRELTGGGVDYAFVTTSAPGAFELGTEALRPRGSCILIAGYPDDVRVTMDPGWILNGERRVMASKYGSSNPPVDVPVLVDLYLRGHLPLERLVTGRWPIAEVDEAYEQLRSGRVMRGLLMMDPHFNTTTSP